MIYRVAATTHDGWATYVDQILTLHKKAILRPQTRALGSILWVFVENWPCYTWIFHLVNPDINSLRTTQNGRHFPDGIFQCIFLNENVCISLKISLKFVPDVRMNNIPALVQIMAWRRPGDKPLSEPMMVNLLTHICVNRPQWFNVSYNDLQRIINHHWYHYQGDLRFLQIIYKKKK